MNTSRRARRLAVWAAFFVASSGAAACSALLDLGGDKSFDGAGGAAESASSDSTSSKASSASSSSASATSSESATASSASSTTTASSSATASSSTTASSTSTGTTSGVTSSTSSGSMSDGGACPQCMGDACKGGECEPTVFLTLSASSNYVPIATDGTYLFAYDSGLQEIVATVIDAQPMQGTKTIASGVVVEQLAATANAAVWRDGTSGYHVSSYNQAVVTDFCGGGNTATQTIATDAFGAVYWGDDMGVYEGSLAGCTPTSLAATGWNVTAIAAASKGAKGLFWGGVDPWFQVTITDGVATYPGSSAVDILVADASWLYWSDGTELNATPQAPVQEMAFSIGAMGGMVGDPDGGVVFTQSGNCVGLFDGSIERYVPNGVPTPLVSARECPYAIAATSTFLFWSEGNNVIRLVRQ